MFDELFRNAKSSGDVTRIFASKIFDFKNGSKEQAEFNEACTRAFRRARAIEAAESALARKKGLVLLTQ